MIITSNLKKGSFLTIGLFIFLNLGLCGQDTSRFIDTRDELLNYAEAVYGSDDMIINGRIYVPQHTLAEGHPYFEIADWVMGDVFIRGHRFKNLKLKYDIDLDEFVLYIEDKYQRKNYLVLNHHYVDSVYLGKYIFINTAAYPGIGRDLGYAELVYDNGLIFLVTYEKDFKKQYSESKPYGEYGKQYAERYIASEGSVSKVTSKKAFLKYFESYKKEIRRYMKKQKINYRKAGSGTLKNLFTYCHELYSGQ
jgi:hypothetical protein